VHEVPLVRSERQIPKREGYEINEIDEIRGTEQGLNSFNSSPRSKATRNDRPRPTHRHARLVNKRYRAFGTGCRIFLFGVDLPQTFEGYSYLFAHFGQLPRPNRENDWRERIKMIHAKAQSSPNAIAQFRERSYDLFAEHLYEADQGDDPFTYNADDVNAPHYSWPIYLDSTFSEFDPIANPSFIQSSVYRAAFGEFIENTISRFGFDVMYERLA
jgi:hypothetical protein